MTFTVYTAACLTHPALLTEEVLSCFLFHCFLYLLAVTSSSIGPVCVYSVCVRVCVYVCEDACLCSCQLGDRGHGKGSGNHKKTHNFQMDPQTRRQFREKVCHESEDS